MADLVRFSDRFHQHCTTDANACVFLGVDKHLGDLPDPTVEACESRLSEAKALLDELDGLAQAELDFDARLDLDLARLRLQAEVHDDTYTFNGATRLSQTPRASDDIGDGIFLMFINDPRPAGDRLTDIRSRLEAVPDYLQATVARLRRPIKRWVDIDAEKCDGLPELFDTIVSWSEGENWADHPRLVAAAEAAKSALGEYAAKLRACETEEKFAIGSDQMAQLIALRGITKTPSELHQMAADFLTETRETIEELRGRLATKYDLPTDASADDVQRFLAKKYRVETDGRLSRVLDRYREERERIRRFCDEHQLFPIPEGQDLKILQTPDFMAPSIPAGAMMPPAPFRPGVKTSLIYLTVSEELLDEHTELTIPSMMIHEGIPGHHLQLGSAAMHPSVIRRHINANDHGEGWTTMLEDYMLDLGYMGELTDEARFCGKLDISRVGARVAIDLYFMSGDESYLDVGVDCDLSSDDPFVSAGNLLKAVTGFVDARCQGELNWYSQERGYPLSYLTGNRAVWDLKHRVEAKNKGTRGPRELDREFHRVYLSYGNMPVSFLDRSFAHEGLL